MQIVIRLWHQYCEDAAEMARVDPYAASSWFVYGLLVGLVLFFGGRTNAAVPSVVDQPQGAANVYRPIKAEEHAATLGVEDLRILDLNNQRAIEIFTTASDLPGADGATTTATFGEIVIRNCEIGNLRRDETGAKAGAQVEGIRITGGGDQESVATDLLIEDVYIHDGQGVPIRIQDGKFGTITLRRVRIEQMLAPVVQVVFINSGSARRILIEDSPGLVVRLMGKPGSVGEVATSGSPDAKILDELSSNKPASAEVVTDAAKPAGTEEPVKLAVTPQTPAAPKSVVPNTAPATKPKPAAPAKPIELSAVAEDGSVKITVANVPADVSHITFGLFNRFDYRIGVPVVVTEAPWEATIKAGRAGTYVARITVTRAGGDSDRPMEKSVDVK